MSFEKELNEIETALSLNRNSYRVAAAKKRIDALKALINNTGLTFKYKKEERGYYALPTEAFKQYAIENKTTRDELRDNYALTYKQGNAWDLRRYNILKIDKGLLK